MLETLLTFENPIRIAQVYNWLGLAWARQIPKRQHDLNRGEEYLKKALRIRERHQQKYTCGLSAPEPAANCTKPSESWTKASSTTT